MIRCGSARDRDLAYRLPRYDPICDTIEMQGAIFSVLVWTLAEGGNRLHGVTSMAVQGKGGRHSVLRPDP